MNTLISRKN